ncbi:MAG: chemotaxis protein CheW [Nitrospirae bacterium]|nr:chemotaxis protein CheW [Nitrospirota bacterium]
MEELKVEAAEKNYCVFRVGEMEFLLPEDVVKEIVDIKKIFTVPGAPDYVSGVIPSHGKIIPAIDLSKIYPVEEFSYSNARLIIVDVKDESIGFISESIPFFTKIDASITMEDIIDVKKFFETYKIKKG